MTHSATNQGFATGDLKNGRTQHNQAVKVELCVMFLKIGEIDTIHEHFSADVLIKAQWREPALDGQEQSIDLSTDDWRCSLWDPQIFVENTIGDAKETIAHNVAFNKQQEAFVCETRRLRATFVENLELNDFPFDVQDLTVVVASERQGHEVEFVDNKLDMHRVCKRSFVDEQEWRLYNHIETARDGYSDEMVVSETRMKPMYLVRCRAARRSRFFLVNMYTMSFLIVMLTFTTFSVAYYKPEYRLKLTFALLLTSVTFKLVASNSLPKISYVTYLDLYNFFALGMIVVTCIWHAVSSTLEEAVAIVANNIALGVLIGVFVLFNIGYGLYIYFNVFRKRREMTRKDEEYHEQMNQLDSVVLDNQEHNELGQQTSSSMNSIEHLTPETEESWAIKDGESPVVNMYL